MKRLCNKFTCSIFIIKKSFIFDFRQNSILIKFTLETKSHPIMTH